MAIDIKPLFNGTHGAVWVTLDSQEFKVGEMKTFKAKQTNSYEDVDVSEVFTKQRKLVGVELTGEFTKFKADSNFINIAERNKNGETVEVSIVGKAYNPETKLVQRVKLEGVTFDEFMLIDLEQKTLTEESLPFAFTDYSWLEK